MRNRNVEASGVYDESARSDFAGEVVVGVDERGRGCRRLQRTAVEYRLRSRLDIAEPEALGSEDTSVHGERAYVVSCLLAPERKAAVVAVGHRERAAVYRQRARTRLADVEVSVVAVHRRPVVDDHLGERTAARRVADSALTGPFHRPPVDLKSVVAICNIIGCFSRPSPKEELGQADLAAVDLDDVCRVCHAFIGNLRLGRKHPSVDYQRSIYRVGLSHAHNIGGNESVFQDQTDLLVCGNAEPEIRR